MVFTCKFCAGPVLEGARDRSPPGAPSSGPCSLGKMTCPLSQSSPPSVLLGLERPQPSKGRGRRRKSQKELDFSSIQQTCVKPLLRVRSRRHRVTGAHGGASRTTSPLCGKGHDRRTSAGISQGFHLGLDPAVDSWPLHATTHTAPSGREAQEQGCELFRESSPALAQGIGGGASNSRQKLPESSSQSLPKPVPKH